MVETPRTDRCPEGPCPVCGTPVKNVSDTMTNKTGKELYAVECPKCGWETVLQHPDEDEPMRRYDESRGEDCGDDY
jgi:rRNA maturation protein Nop10